jgi:hypothetical protein
MEENNTNKGKDRFRYSDYYKSKYPSIFRNSEEKKEPIKGVTEVKPVQEKAPEQNIIQEKKQKVSIFKKLFKKKVMPKTIIKEQPKIEEKQVKLVSEIIPRKTEKLTQTDLQKIEKIMREENKPRKENILKILLLLVVIGTLVYISYIFYANFLLSKDIMYYYDIGSSEDAKNPYLFPENRTTPIDNLTSSRNITSWLVYFSVPASKDSLISIQTRYKKNFPAGYQMTLGARDQEDWHYKYKELEEFDDNTWTLGEVQFDVKNDSLVTRNKEISMLFDLTYLAKPEYQKYTVPIDWITITVHKPGLIEKLNNLY